MRIYDNKGETADRYTLVMRDNIKTRDVAWGKTIMRKQWIVVSACSKPFHPIGVCCGNVEPFAPDKPTSKHLGKRIAFKDLPEDTKHAFVDYWPISNFRLPKAYSKYGAQMGRSNTATGKCTLGKVRPVDGDYDNGGAYWGFGRDSEDIYVAKSKKSAYEWPSEGDTNKTGFSFVRANSPYEALKHFESMGLTF